MDEKKPKVTTDMLIGEIIVKYPDAAFALMQCGMGCIGCPSSQGETLEQAAFDLFCAKNMSRFAFDGADGNDLL